MKTYLNKQCQKDDLLKMVGFVLRFCLSIDHFILVHGVERVARWHKSHHARHFCFTVASRILGQWEGFVDEGGSGLVCGLRGWCHVGWSIKSLPQGAALVSRDVGPVGCLAGPRDGDPFHSERLERLPLVVNLF